MTFTLTLSLKLKFQSSITSHLLAKELIYLYKNVF